MSKQEKVWQQAVDSLVAEVQRREARGTSFAAYDDLVEHDVRTHGVVRGRRVA